MRPGNVLTRNLAGVGIVVALAASLGLAGCGGETDDRPPTWSFVYPAIIEPSCATASCHSDFTRRAGVNLGFSDEAYFQMVDRRYVVQCAVPPAVPDPRAPPGCLRTSRCPTSTSG